MAFMDNETGEITVTNHMSDCNLDMETGECCGDENEIHSTGTIRKTKFNIPKSYLVQSEPKKTKEKCCLDSQETYSLTSKAKVIELKEVTKVQLTQFSNVKNFQFSENHPRLQQNQPPALPHPIALHLPTHCRDHSDGHRDYAARLESQQEHKKLKS